MPRRKTLKPEVVRTPATIKLRVDPYFAVRVVADSDGRSHAHKTFIGATAREALQHAKNDLVAQDRARKVSLYVTNGKLVDAIGWNLPTYPDDTLLLERLLKITGGMLLETE